MSGVEPIEPHEYVYGGFEVMGDCGKCGHVREDSIHVTPERAGASMSGDPTGKSAAFGDVCTCGHAADWHSHGGAGDCEHDAECGCGVYRDAITCQPGCACGDPTLCGTAPPEEVHIAQRERWPGQLTDYWTRRDLASSTRMSGASMSGDPTAVTAQRCAFEIERKWPGHRVVLSRRRCKNRVKPPHLYCYVHRYADPLYPWPVSRPGRA